MIAALQLGALPLHLSWIQLAPWTWPDEKGFGKAGRFASYTIFPTGILINPQSGHRIVNEWGDRRVRAEAILQTGRPCLGILDSRGVLQDKESLKACLISGKVQAFGDLVSLARHYSIPSEALLQTVELYNQAINDRRIDEFGKNLATGAIPLANPPFYGVRLWPKVHYTPGGIGITETAQVMDLRGQIIPHLFAAGEVCGGVHGVSRLGGCSLTECLVFGRIAGRDGAKV